MRSMKILKSTSIFLLWIGVLQVLAEKGVNQGQNQNQKAKESSEEKVAVPDNLFAKRQGFVLTEGEDQVAMESQMGDQVAVESAPDQVAVESGKSQHQVPVPVPIRTVPGTILLPMPPQGFQPPGLSVRMRAPPPYVQQGFQQGQYSHPHQTVVQAPTPQPHTQILSTPAGDLKIQKATEFSIQNHQARQPHTAGLVPPHLQQQYQNQQPHQPRFNHHQQQHHQQQQNHQRPHQGPQGMSSSEITKNIIRELFERKPPGLKNGQPTGGFFGPPSSQPQPKVVQSLTQPNQQRPLIAGKPGSGLFGKEAALTTNDLHAEGGEIRPAIHNQFGSREQEAWPAGPDSDTPKIVSLEVKCERSVMRVFVAFDKPFYGVIFSKGHYHNMNCIHLPAGLGHTSANFDINIDSCGTQGNSENGIQGYGIQGSGGSYYENVVVIQYDSQVQEVWDQARKLRCTWHDQYEKSVTFRPFPVDQLDVVRADFAGDNVGCWMQIQVGKGPWASEVSGIVKIGQTMTMVLAIKDDDNKFDMMVRNCVAHDGHRAPIQLVDQFGCITRQKLMSGFTKIKNFGASATVLSYAHFQAFKFPDSMEVHFQCTIQICRHQCPEQCTPPSQGGIGKSGLPAGDEEDEDSGLLRRKRRAANLTGEEPLFEYQTTFKTNLLAEEDVGLNKVITVISPEDMDFEGGQDASSGEDVGDNIPLVEGGSNIVCMSMLGFAAMITLLIGLLLVACIISAVIVLKRRPRRKGF